MQDQFVNIPYIASHRKIKYNGHTFVDGTFITAPNPFYHSLMIMVFDNITDWYSPCFSAS
ncbi:hypothetical protein HZS_8088 [Henneguya salminicola]|nr:hypothetical protein HZS_8088 [Henneguya salminicola]